MTSSLAIHYSSHTFGALDWSIVALSACILLGIGYYYSRRQKTTEDYFVAGRKQNPIVAGISLFAALFTLVAYVGVPGEIVENGPVLVIASVTALPFTYLIISRFLIPLFMRLPITSGYDLLETRLGKSVRLTASLTFISVRLVWMSLILYAAASVLVSVIGCDHRWMPALEAAVGTLATLFTLAGGIEAVMTMAVLEFALLVLGAVMTVGLITYRSGGFQAWWPQHAPPHWPAEPIFSLSPFVRVTAFGTFVDYFISTVCAGGSDQVAIQRYLTTRNIEAARRASLFGHITVGVILLTLGVVGAALLGYYQRFPEELPHGLNIAQAGDGLFPYFLSHGLPQGISGLVVAGLLTSAVSGISPSINSVIAVGTKQFIEPLIGREANDEAKKIRLARLLSLGIGAIIIFGSLAMGRVNGNLIEVSSKTVNVFFYPMFGLFFMAIFVRYATSMGSILGAIFGLTTGIVIGYWDVLTGQPKLSFQWIGAISLFVTLAAGCFFSMIPISGKSLRVKLAWSCGALIGLAATVACLTRLSHD